MNNDTIAAIATGLTNSGIGIIRLCGPDAIEIADRIYFNKKNQRTLRHYKSNTIHYGFIKDVPDGEDPAQIDPIDEIMVSVLLAPNSYTTEDTVEFNCHGGIYLVQKVLDLVLHKGARMAEPGEFTKRAFLNGRIDLSRAEAVMDIIQSSNDFALKSSMKQLRGELSDKIKELRNSILYEIAFIESALDDPEHISLEGYPWKLMEKVNCLEQELSHILKNSENGKILKEGINTVIVGKPNAGKSSLLNLLAGEERAIVTDIAGTTRDIIEEHIQLNGVSLNIIDTAGIHSTDDRIEKIGVEKAEKYAKDADLVIYVVDSSIPLDENDHQIIQMIQNKKTILLFNKSDLEQCVEESEFENAGCSYLKLIRTSTKENTGFDLFEDAIREMFVNGDIAGNDELFITNMRHKELIKDAYESILLVKKSIEDQMPEDFFSIDLMNAYSSLGFIIGEEVEDDLVNEIFSKFCTGK